MNDWQVADYQKFAFREWVERCSPSAAERAALVWHLNSWKDAGPPVLSGVSPKTGFPQAPGPNGETIEFICIPTPLGEEPPYGVIMIHSISCSEK